MKRYYNHNAMLIPVLSAFMCLGCLGALNSTNKFPTVSEAGQVSEAVWKQSPELYYKRMRNDAKLFRQRKLAGDERQALFVSFTNLTTKPLPSHAEESKHSLLRLQSLSIIEFSRNDIIREDKRSWEEIAKHIGKIRDEIVPDYAPQANPLEEPYMLPPSKEREQKIKEYNDKLMADNFQRNLALENRSLTGRLEAYIQNQRTHGNIDIQHIEHLMLLAKFTDDEKEKMIQWINEK
ncbi:hypothetical protein [Pontiella sp.]|uniref:hypothetical protein n=1 Tax=Pontiella sp. TaxID=2837462 RepID=UPI003563C979